MPSIPKLNPIRDRRYLEWLKTQPCIISGACSTDDEKVVPAHIGTMGKSIKSSDDEVFPLLNRFHQMQPSMGELSMYRKYAPEWFLRECLRSYARDLYKQFLENHSTNPGKPPKTST